MLRTAFTIIEVLLATIVLSASLFALGQGVFSARSMQVASASDRAVGGIIRTIGDRFLTANWQTLRQAPQSSTDAAISTQAWSWGRYVNQVAIRPTGDGLSVASPMTETSTVPANSLIAQGIISKSTGLQNLKVFVEWYRGTSCDANDNGSIESPGELGVLDTIVGVGPRTISKSVPLPVQTSDTPALSAIRPLYALFNRQLLNGAWQTTPITQYDLTNLAYTGLPTGQPDSNGVLTIRVIVTFDDPGSPDLTQIRSAFFSRRP